jgi:hypothetical protein
MVGIAGVQPQYAWVINETISKWMGLFCIRIELFLVS